MYKSITSLFLAFMLISTFACKNNNNDDDDTINTVDNLPNIIGYPIVSTNQTTFYGDQAEISAPAMGDPYFGQNASYIGNELNYVDNGDGTVTDMVTGLMWQQSCDFNGDEKIDVYDKMSQAEAVAFASSYNLANHTDWRLPTIKEAYSLIIFSGVDPSGYTGTTTDNLVPFLNDTYFDFDYGDTDNGERLIDAQFASSTIYVSTTMMGDNTMFGVNLADGRIKGYPTGAMPGQTQDKQFYVLYVRGNSSYGLNSYTDNGNGTITDNATELMWMQNDSDTGMVWKDALAYAEGKDFAGHSDWRLPNTKELQSIVDYTRSPSSSSSAAIDPLFLCTQITNEASESDYPAYWTSTTHSNWSAGNEGTNAAYVCFGRAMGNMNSTWMDVHGAGAQRSDPKVGNPSDYPTGNGPQGDAVRIYNHVRLVRNI